MYDPDYNDYSESLGDSYNEFKTGEAGKTSQLVPQLKVVEQKYGKYLRELGAVIDKIEKVQSLRNRAIRVIDSREEEDKQDTLAGNDENIVARRIELETTISDTEKLNIELVKEIEAIEQRGVSIAEHVIALNKELFDMFLEKFPYEKEQGNTPEHLQRFYKWKEGVLTKAAPSTSSMNGNSINSSLLGRLGIASDSYDFDVYTDINSESLKIISIGEALNLKVMLVLANLQADVRIFDSGKDDGFPDFIIPRDTGVVQAGIVDKIKATLKSN